MAKLAKEHISIGTITILHLIGIVGLSLAEDWFLPLTPLNLLVSTYLVLRHAKKPKQALFGAIVVLAWGVECLGIHTGWPFGDYRYGSALGPQLYEVPVLIGLLWLLLLMGSMHLASRLSSNRWLKSTLAAALMTGIDFLIEPVAIRFDFWNWYGAEVPWSNYLAWLATAFLLSLLSSLDQSFGNNRTAGLFFLIQVIFFATLNLLAV